MRTSSILLLPVFVAVAGCVPAAYVFEPPPLPAYVYPGEFHTTVPSGYYGDPGYYDYTGRYGYQSYYWISRHPAPVVRVDPGHRHRRVDDRRETGGRDERGAPGPERGRGPRDRDHTDPSHGDRERNGSVARDDRRGPGARIPPGVPPVRPAPRPRESMPDPAGSRRSPPGGDPLQAGQRNRDRARSGTQREAE